MQVLNKSIDLATFKKATKGMVNTSGDLLSKWDRYERTVLGDYTPKRIKEIIENAKKKYDR